MKYDRLEITNGQYVKLSYHTARTGSRVAALIIDRIVQIILFFVSSIVMEGQHLYRNAFLLCAFFYILIYTLNLWQEFLWHGRTLGKVIMRIRVISEDCTPPSFQQCFTRWVLYPIDMWIVGLILIAEKSQRLGDMASGCYVIFEKDKRGVKVSLDDDYRYGKPGYMPVFTNLENMTETDHDLVLKALYNNNYTSQQYAIKQHLRQKLELDDSDMGTNEFLHRLHNDYMYYNCKE